MGSPRSSRPTRASPLLDVTATDAVVTPRWVVRDRVLSSDRPLVMGILNTTPDSFSDGGLFVTLDAAVAHGRAMAAAGADIIDVGGESTRPGSVGVDAATELDRVIAVITALADDGTAVSVDTTKPEVAAAALEAGAVVINDVSALRSPGMAELVADSGAGVVLMHMLGEPRSMQDEPVYDDVVEEVGRYLADRAGVAEVAGIAPDRICLDPGIGFGKRLGHNLALLANVDRLAAIGYLICVGASRKSWMEQLLGPVPMDERDALTTAAHALAIARGAGVIRTHDVVMGLRSARISAAIVAARRGETA